MSSFTGVIENVLMTVKRVEFKLKDRNGKITELYCSSDSFDSFRKISANKIRVTCLTKRSEVLKVLI